MKQNTDTQSVSDSHVTALLLPPALFLHNVQDVYHQQAQGQSAISSGGSDSVRQLTAIAILVTAPQDTVQIQAHNFGKDREVALKDELNKKYANKVSASQ